MNFLRRLTYSQQGLWFNFLSTLVDLRYCNADDTNLAKRWQKTLTQVNLQSIAQEKLFDSLNQPPNCPKITGEAPPFQTETVNSLIRSLREIRNIRNKDM